ncbi:unnamed protein product [Calypogeia fissa]
MNITTDTVPVLSDSMPLLVDNGPVSKIPSVDGEEAMSDATDVQLPFSLADYDVERKKDAQASDAPILVKCPKVGLLSSKFASCDLAANSWQMMASSVLVPQLLVHSAGTFGRIFSGGGLVLVEKLEKQHYRLVVSNPSSKAQRQLPPPMLEFSKPEVLGIFVDPETACYKIPVIQRRYNETEMDLVLMQEYDSVSDSWEFAGQWRNRFQVEPIGAVYVNGTLFFLTYDRQAHAAGREERDYHIYYVDDCVWERLELPLGLGFPAIFEHRGRMMLIGGLHEAYDSDYANSSSVAQSVCIWEHEWQLMRWTEVCKMPHPWVEELYKCAPEAQPKCTLQVTAGGNFVCIASSNGTMTKCDLAKNVWARLPKCDIPKYADGDRILILELKPDIPV